MAQAHSPQLLTIGNPTSLCFTKRETVLIYRSQMIIGKHEIDQLILNDAFPNEKTN